ncbi:MFS transporter [Streptomyces prunicolor]|uniref:MFS transporter n=1 Tax=Streptomyces prunicolor TaxID=67348 RepID=A0ABU4FBM3_9ACTN|nr:MFS transporter [Streptomyces prunicolor]MDV7217997.1 MFS transporter [Streptomyces prunicolor]
MRKWLPLSAVCLGTFMLLVDVTIVNVALPDMAADLHTSLGALQWVVDGYALALAALLLGIGSLADRIGHRRCYIGGLALFAVASLASGLAPTTSALITARIVQGVGAAAMFATTFALLNSSYTGRDRATAYGMWGAVSGASSAAGPLLGGPLTQGLSWRWIFFVNLPVSAVAIATCLFVLRDAHTRDTRRLDMGGVALFTVAIGSLTFAMIRTNEHGWSDPACWSMLLTGAVFLLAFVIAESRIAEPVLDLALLRNSTFSGVLIAAVLLNFAAYVSFAYTSIWMQSVLRLSPVTAGLVSLPMSVAAFVVSASLGRAMHRWRPGRVISGGILLIGVGDLLAAALVDAWPSWPALLPGFLVVGLGVGFAAPPLSATGMAAAPPQRGGMAAGAINTARQVGFAFGIALLGSVFTAGTQHALVRKHLTSATALAHDVAAGQSAQVLHSATPGSRDIIDQAIRAAAAHGIDMLLFVAGLIGVAAALISFLMIRQRPSVEDTPELPAPTTSSEERHSANN